jgi:hypothetical protein
MGTKSSGMKRDFEVTNETTVVASWIENDLKKNKRKN